MNQTPKYSHLSIGSINSLARLLRLPINRVKYLATNSSDFFRVARIEEKKSGGQRITYDAFKCLKDVHRRLKVQIFQRVTYPSYLQGSLKGCSYITNVKNHTKSKIIICEDISNYFPSIKFPLIEKMFMRLFGFPEDVARILTQLVTLNGLLPQGGVCSSYIANLVMWEKEVFLVGSFEKRGLTYTRYVDDITVSSKAHLTKSEISEVISSIYGMMKRYGIKPNLKKHQVLGDGSHQKVHNVGVNGRRPSFGKEEKKRVRSAVHKLKLLFDSSDCTYEDYLAAFGRTSSLVGKLKQLNEQQATKHRGELNKIKPSFRNVSNSNLVE